MMLGFLSIGAKVIEGRFNRGGLDKGKLGGRFGSNIFPQRVLRAWNSMPTRVLDAVHLGNRNSEAGHGPPEKEDGSPGTF